MRVLFAGLWARRGLNAASLLVTLIAVTAAVLAPMYGRASAEHLVDTRIDQRAPYTTGLAYSVPALADGQLPKGSPSAYHAPDPMSLVRKADDVVSGPGVAAYWGAAVPWLLDKGGVLSFGGHQFQVPLYWRAGMCDLAVIQGRCPARPGEVLVQQTMARTLDVAAGDQVALGFTDQYLRASRAHGRATSVQVEHHRSRSYRVVGTYRITDPDSPGWFDLSRFTGIDDLQPSPGKLQGGATLPAAPALLTAPSSMDSQTFRGGVDRPIDVAAVDVATLDAAQRAADAFKTRALSDSSVGEVGLLDVKSVFDEVRAEHALLSRVMVAALAPLVVLALLLLHALVAAAAQVRRPYVALAKLRGHSRVQVLRFAVAEPFLVAALAAPAGAGLAVAGAHLVARLWLRPGIPVAPDPTAWVAFALVVLSVLVASTLAAFGVTREPLAAALRAPVRARPSSRFALVLRGAVVALAVASVAQLLVSGHQSSQLLALLAPLFIALAVSVGGAVLLRLLGRWWVGRTAASGGAASFLASRRLARRPDLANLMMPMLLAVSMVTFASSASAVSDDWRVSRARADVGAATAYQADTTPGHLLETTRRLDPSGRHLMAAVVDNGGEGMQRRVFVDASRLASVAAWDPSWSDVPVSTLQRRLAGGGRRLAFTGGTVSVRVTDVHLTSQTHAGAELWLQYVDDGGAQRDVLLGRLRGAGGDLTAAVHGCARRCLVEQVFLSGGAQSVSDADGSLTLSEVRVDGKKVDWGLRRAGAWRAAHPFPVSLVDAPVALEPGRAGLRLRVYLGQLPPGKDSNPTMVSGYARVTPGSTPGVAPVLVAAHTATRPAAMPGGGTAIAYGRGVVAGIGLSGASAPMRVVGRVRALPVLGDEGELGDLETSLVEYEPPAGAIVVTELWAAPGTPAALLAKVRDSGIPLTPLGKVATTLRELRGDAFSLGLRLFLIVGLATLLLAVFGVFASAVLQSRWRSYEVASLRVVGVPQRSLVRGSVLEYVVMLGVAVLLGVFSTYLALELVLPSMSLGTAAPHEPAPRYPVHWSILGVAALALFALAAGIALVVSRHITRRGRPSTLRWAESG